MPEQRKLTTIMAVDVAGYSRAAEMDESAAAEAVRALRSLIDAIVVPLGGRIFNTAGDGFMIELPTASAGVVAATQLLTAPNAPQGRIGLHMGEVIVSENGDLLGHGVNVAARLQQMAEPGSAIVSQAVQAQIHGGRVRLTPLGKVQLDKMQDRLEVFALSPSAKKSFARVAWRRARRSLLALLVVGLLGIGGYAVWRLNAPLQPEGTPRLAILRFETQGEADPYFAEAVADDLIAQVSRIEGLDVIARTSSFALTGERATPVGAAEDLNATLVLMGTVRRVGDRVRVAANLAEALSGRNVWVRDFERPLAEIYLLQNDIAVHVALAVGLRVNAPSARRTNPEAYELYVRGRELWLSGSTREAAQALFEQAVERDPNFGQAWSELATARIGNALRIWNASPAGVPVSDERLNAALEAADRAIALEPDAAAPYQARSRALQLLGRQTESLRAAEEATERGGNVGWVYRDLGYLRDTATSARRGVELDPLNSTYHVMLFSVCVLRAEISCALEEAELSGSQPPFEELYLLHRIGRTSEAIELTRQQPAAWQELLAPEPFFTMDVLRATLGEGEPPAIAAIGEALSRGELYPDSAVKILTETDRPGGIAPLLRHWADADRPSVPSLYDVRLGPMRAQPEFWALMERYGIAGVWRETGRWPDFCERERAVCEQHLSARRAD